MDYLKYNIENKEISQVKFSKKNTGKSESIFALGNGYMGLRSVDEERTSYNKEDFFVNGIFNKDNKDEVSELANLADLIQTPIYFDGKIFSVNEKDQYLKTLKIREGVLERNLFVERNKNKFELNFERFVSQDNLHLYGQRIEIKVLELNDQKDYVKVTLEPGINAQVTNSGTQHFSEGLKSRPTTESLYMEQKTTFSKKMVAHNLITKLYLNGELIKGGSDDYVIDIKRRMILFKINVNLKKGDVLVLEKLMSVNTSVDGKSKLLDDSQVREESKKMHELLLNSSYEELKNASIEKMQTNVWNQFFVEIEGDESSKYDRLALDFAIFHQNSFVPKHSTNLNVGAKGLSGEGYQGHTYWDTEFFINPNFLFTNPKIVRNLLEYRYKGIKGARAKAKEIKLRNEESNLEGAQFPWEMAWPTEGEVCPYWGQADVVSGEQVPIASRRQEIHVSADIAYAVNQYYQITKDEQFMRKAGYEMIIDTAWFYTNRAELQEDGTYHIRDVMGPNEYKGNIDNNAYINLMAKYNIDLALKVMEQLKQKNKSLLNKILNKIPYKINVSKMKTVSKMLKQQKPNSDLIVAENDQFLSLPLIDVKPFQMLGDAGKKLFSTKEGHKRLCSQLVKQADVVLLMQILPEYFSKEVRDKNFDYYENITTHDSSLSAATYVIEGVRLRKMKRAYELFKYAIDVDMGPKMHTSNAGIHAGSLSAIWQMIVFGFGGLTWVNNQLHLSPKLPQNWDKLTYRILFEGVWLEVSVNQNTFSVHTVEKHKRAYIYINNKLTEITHNPLSFEVKND
ncbi:glycosyl hydrolase family 65 protein [Mycoplasmopsis ciconiae]|uniref:Glycosyl hydrolase family 65 protein n=1 Tax=Mycoplasmopsis ciconiae TaxID=561067 RepID=A0ABU7MMK5_9BACT|nr:glycosyl hydrolase family 65 protein [Mycoplasmopsis ciconiae]